VAQMMGWESDWGWGQWLAMSLTMLLLWLIVGWAIVAAVRSWHAPGTRDDPNRARQLLDERYARGEIDQDEYEHRRSVLAR
jgi:putative membrane protein